MKKIGILILICFFSTTAFSQNSWDDAEIAHVFDGVDVTAALERVEAKGITPYDFGRDLLNMGHPDRAKEWFVAVGIHTKDLKYVYGLGWTKWVTGDSQGALNDAAYILQKSPTPIIRARTLYLLGAIYVDEHKFKEARENLQAGLEAYRALDKSGGQYLCMSMMAMCAVYERKLDEVEPLLNKALEYNEIIRKRGFIARSMGRAHEIISELRFAQGDFDGALLSAEQSVDAYRESSYHNHADEVQAKIALLLLMTGEPKAAHELASRLWQTHHKARDRGRLLAYNSITLMKLSLCAQREEDAADKERAALTWANSGPGGRALIRLLEWVKDKNNVPCPQWR